VAVGCQQCGGTGYRGRTVLAEMLTLEHEPLAQAVLNRSDVQVLRRLAAGAGMVDLRDRARAAVEQGVASPAEIRRVLGFGKKCQE